MNIRDITEKYNLDYAKFREYIVNSGVEHKEHFWTSEVTVQDDMDTDRLVNDYTMTVFNKSYREMLDDHELKQEQSQSKKEALANMLITSGFNFDGYRIVKYSGYISGDDAISVDRGFTFMGSSSSDVRQDLMGSLVQIRRKALQELKEHAYNLGCNAVIGVDFDYITLDPHTKSFSGNPSLQPYVFGVTANGNAVIIEKEEG